MSTRPSLHRYLQGGIAAVVLCCALFILAAIVGKGVLVVHAQAPAPVAHYTFDEGSGSTANDETGNHDATLYNSPSWVTGKFGSALQFNGTTTYVELPNESAFDFTTDFSISFWMKTDDYASQWAGLVTKGNYAWSISRYVWQEEVDFSAHDGTDWSGIQGSTYMNDDTWHHVVATYDGSTQKLYVDGSLEATSSLTGPIATSNDPVRIGNLFGVADTFYAGAIDDVIIYDEALSEQETAAMYQEGVLPVTAETPPAPVAHYTFDEGSGSTANDATGNHDATLYNSPTWVTGKFGSALEFNGTSTYVELPNESAFDFTTDFSASFWMKTNDFNSQWAGLVAKGDYAWSISRYVWQEEVAFSTYDGENGHGLQGSTYMNDGIWHHVVATYDGSTQKLYVDGVLEASGAFSGPIATSNEAVRIGNITGIADSYYAGAIDDVRIYDRALSEQEIAGVSFGLPSAIEVSPNDDVQDIIDGEPAGTTYVFTSGTYRLQKISPQEGDVFLAEPGAVLNGSTLVTSWTATSSYWAATGMTMEGQVHGNCISGYPRCNHPEDLFIDDVPLLHVSSLLDVSTSTYYFDYDADTIYIGQNPSGKEVEVSTTRVAFAPTADDVTIRGFVIEKYAIPAQMGAVGEQFPAEGWVVEDNEVRWNHGTGIFVSDNSIMRGNYVHHNGQKGIGAEGDNVLIENNEVSHNLWNGTDWGWDGGGSKFANTDNLVVRNNYVHHNKGPGLWTDIDNINTLYEYNTVIENDTSGIKHEISYDAIIRNNIATENGVDWDDYLFGAGILIQNSSDVEVYDNYVTLGAESGNGITIIEQNRGSGAYGPYVTKNADIHDNEIIHLGDSGTSGTGRDYSNPDFFTSVWNMQWDDNNYHSGNTTRAIQGWNDMAMSFGFFQSQFGQETDGSIDTNITYDPPAPVVSVSSSATTINSGERVKLEYSAGLATSCTATWKEGDKTAGSVVVAPTTTTTYTLNCEGEGGNSSDNVEVTVL